MAEVVSTEIVGQVGLVALNNPPVNAAGVALRTGLVAAVDALEANDAVAVIALYGAGRSFVAGADIKEFGKPPRAPFLPDVCNRLETCTKPVISVLHGAALGGGLEVAIATHARIALAGVQLGFPEVTLGIIPGAGGTQRAPRLMRMGPALDLITTGRRIGAEAAVDAGLIDRVTSGTPREVALKAAADVVAGQLPTRRTGDIVIQTDEAALTAAATSLARKQNHLFSPHRCVDAVAAAALPLRDGLAEERRLFNLCMESPQRAGLVHAFFAERAVAHIPEATAQPRDIATVGVIGGGTMGTGIATACLIAGCPVILVDAQSDAAARAETRIADALDGAVARGKMTPEARAAVHLATTTDLTRLAEVDLVIEAAFEDMSVKRDLFGTLGEICKPGTILATNTSYLDVNDIAAASGRPEDVIGLHFFSPAHVMRLLEVVVARDTAPEVVATGFALAKRLKKVAVRAGVCDGFIGNRVMQAYRLAADHMMLDGTPPSAIDQAIRAFGFAMGPFETSDLAGLDIAWANRKRLAAHRDPAARYVGGVADALCEAGQFGRKTGIGFYDYAGDTPVLNPALEDLISAEQARLGVTPVALDPDAVTARYLTAMIAEAVRVLEDGIALRPIDIDAVFLFGYGFPRWRGGPLHYADTLGPDTLIQNIETFAETDPLFWRVPTLLVEMRDTGRRFADMN